MCDRLGLPVQVQRAFEKKGLTSLYPWQADCLTSSGVLEGNNLIYSLPTSGGKSLIADIVCLRSLLYRDKSSSIEVPSSAATSKVLIVLPFVSLVKDKERELKAILHLYNLSVEKTKRIKVMAFYGGSGQTFRDPKTLKCSMIMICTIEKSSAVFNALLSSNRIDQLKLCVIDELHLLQDPG